MKSPAAFNLNQYLDRVCARVDAALDKLLPPETAAPPTIHKAMRYSIFAGGKRIRPVLCLAACEAVGDNVLVTGQVVHDLFRLQINRHKMLKKNTRKSLYTRPAEMEPLLPGSENPRLPAQTLALIRGAEQLGSSLHPITRAQVADLLRSMNSYYSNLLEGHRTKPRDIDAALRRDFSSNPAQRSLQVQHLAHMEVQAEMETRLRDMPADEICSRQFLCWLHEEFYRRLPEEFCQLEDDRGKVHKVQPGTLRHSEVSVGRHLAPARGG